MTKDGKDIGLVGRIKDLCDGKDGRPQTLIELAKDLDLGERSIYTWDKNVPTVIRIDKVANRLGVTIEYLLRGDGTDESRG